jgi:hypothetical protein
MRNLLLSVFVFACVQQLAIAQDIIQAEYFIDADAGVGKNSLLTLTPAADGAFAFNISLAGIAPGAHKVYFRTKDSNGNWSHTTRRNLDIVASQADNKIVAGEYFFDSDPGYGNASPLTVSPQDSVILQSFTAATAALAGGYHKLYGRFKDDYGNWSQTWRRNAEVAKMGDNAVLMVEYFFKADAGVGNCASSTFPVPVNDGSFVYTIPLSEINADADSLFVRVKDSAQANWSITAYKTNPLILPLTLLRFTGDLMGNNVLLKWETINEVNTAFFTIERSLDGVHFAVAGQVKAAGFSTRPNTYQFIDDPAPGLRIYYRLKQVDRDGKYSYSSVVLVTRLAGGALVNISPNPCTSHFVVNGMNAGPALIIIRDLVGKEIKRQYLSASMTMVSVSDLPHSTYLVTVLQNDHVFTKKLVVQ